jgi:tripartite-type tricarboxylate transporter receptor subunit TctC
MRLCSALIAATALAAAVSLPAHAPANAQDAFPSRPVTMIVPFAPGGSSDVIARIVGEELSRALGQRIVHENVAGAGGTLGLARVAAATPDGYTIVQGNAGTNASSYALYPDLKFKPSAFMPVAMVAKTTSLIALRKDFPAKTLAEFLDYAKKNPSAVRLGHAGVGSNNYIICRSFLGAAGNIDVTLVSYRGGGPALNDAIGGHIDGVCDSASSAAPSIQGGQVKGLVLASESRLASLPDVPTAAEAGVPEFQAGGWNAIFAPAGTPADVIAALNKAVRKALTGELISGRYPGLGVFVPTDAEQSPEFLQKHVDIEIEKHRKLLAAK